MIAVLAFWALLDPSCHKGTLPISSSVWLNSTMISSLEEDHQNCSKGEKSYYFCKVYMNGLHTHTVQGRCSNLLKKIVGPK